MIALSGIITAPAHDNPGHDNVEDPSDVSGRGKKGSEADAPGRVAARPFAG
jgi:hypothetical protein